MEHPYVKRALEDPEVRENAKAAYERRQAAYERLRKVEQPRRRVFDDRKLRKELQDDRQVDRDARESLIEGKRRKRRGGASWCRRSSARPGDRAQRGPAQQGPRRAVRRRGGVRLRLDDRAAGPGRGADAAPAAAPEPVATPAAAEARRRPRRRRRAPSRGQVRGLERRARRRRGDSRRLTGCWLAGRPASIRARCRRPRPLARSRATRRSGSSTRCARRSPAAASPARRSITSRVRPASRAGCCTTTSAPRSGCSPRSSAARPRCGCRCCATASSRAQDADEIIHVLVASLRATIADDPEFVTVLLELFALARRQPEIAVEVQRAARRDAHARSPACSSASRPRGS